jgi:hypothetical protein
MAHSFEIVGGHSKTAAYLSDRAHGLVWSDPTAQQLPAPWSSRGFQIGSFPMLSRLADPYRDTQFSAAEVPGLLTEWSVVLRHLASPPPELRQVFALAQEAAAGGWAVRCTGD